MATSDGPYSLVIETRGVWDNVDTGHSLSTALEDRGATVGGAAGFMLVWSNKRTAYAAARWLAEVYSVPLSPLDNCIDAVCVVSARSNGTPHARVLVPARRIA